MRRDGLDLNVFMLGIDALNLNMVRAEPDRFPVFSELIAEGKLCSLGSSAELASASIWPTFITGKDIGEHGQYFPFQWNPLAMQFQRIDRLPFSAEFEQRPFWFDLADRGHKCVVLDPGQVNTTQKAPCVQILNWSHQSTAKGVSEPPELIRELEKRFGSNPLGAEIPVPKTARHARDVRKQVIAALRKKTDAILWLMQTQEWDFFLAGMFEMHRAGHNLWPVDAEFASKAEPDALLDCYQEMDRQLGRIVKAIDPAKTALVIFSLHGMELNRAQNHFLPAILQRLNAGWRSGSPVTAERARKNAIAWLREAVPHSIQYRAAQILGESIKDWVVNHQFLGGVIGLIRRPFRW